MISWSKFEWMMEEPERFIQSWFLWWLIHLIVRLFCGWLFFRDGLISQKLFILSRFFLWRRHLGFRLLVRREDGTFWYLWKDNDDWWWLSPSSVILWIFHIFRNYCCRKPWIFEQRLRLWDSVWMQGVCKGVLQVSWRYAFALFRIEVSMKQEFCWAERFRVDERNGFTFRKCWVWDLILCREL